MLDSLGAHLKVRFAYALVIIGVALLALAPAQPSSRNRQSLCQKAAWANKYAAESHRPRTYLATPLSYKTATDTRSTEGFAGLSAINAAPMTTSSADPIRNPTF